MDYKETKAALTTITYNREEIEEPTKNIYKAISIISKRAVQISSNMKKELLEKLEKFATYNDGLEEIFKNKEQMEVSRLYEKLPKPTSIAVEEWTNNSIYYRTPNLDED